MQARAGHQVIHNTSPLCLLAPRGLAAYLLHKYAGISHQWLVKPVKKLIRVHVDESGNAREAPYRLVFMHVAQVPRSLGCVVIT